MGRKPASVLRCRALVCSCLLFVWSATAQQTVIRERSEGTLSIPASNVMGSSNIAVFGGLASGYGSDGFQLDPAVGGSIGIGGILQFTAQMVPYSLRVGGLGPVEAHLQATFPRNDRLRFFGAALRADLYLSTALDTINRTADPTKPDYNPYLSPSLILDLDLLAKSKNLPFKTYLFASMADNPQLLFRYDQIAVTWGVEWKTLYHSLFADVGVALYREKGTQLNNFTTDDSYEQMYAWIQPGGRYRFLRRFSAEGGVRVAVFQRLKEANPLSVGIVGVVLKVVAPLYFRETNTEAIRTLVFLEQRKQKKPAVAATAQRDGSFREGIDLTFTGFEDSTETFDYAQETEELVKQRKEIQQRMDEIESLFEDLEGDNP